MLASELDYLMFMYGLGFVLLAITLLGLTTIVSSPLPWRWLAVSAGLLGAFSLVDAVSIAFGEHAGVRGRRGVLLVAAGALLVEFARRSWAARRWPPRRALAPPRAAGADGPRRLRRVARTERLGRATSWASSGGLWGAAALWRFHRSGAPHARVLRVGAVSMGVFAAIEFLLPAPDDAAARRLAGPRVVPGRVRRARRSSSAWPRRCRSSAPCGSTTARSCATPTRGSMIASAEIVQVVVAALLVGHHHRGLGGDLRHRRRAADTERRTELSVRTALAAEAIDPMLVTRQTATPTDVGSVAYEALRRQLAA